MSEHPDFRDGVYREPFMTELRYATLVSSMETGLESEVQKVIESSRSQAAASAGLLARFAVGPIWAVVLTLAQPIARLAIRFALNYLSRMTLGEVADLMSLTRSRNEASGAKPPVDSSSN